MGGSQLIGKFNKTPPPPPPAPLGTMTDAQAKLKADQNVLTNDEKALSKALSQDTSGGFSQGLQSVLSEVQQDGATVQADQKAVSQIAARDADPNSLLNAEKDLARRENTPQRPRGLSLKFRQFNRLPSNAENAKAIANDKATISQILGDNNSEAILQALTDQAQGALAKAEASGNKNDIEAAGQMLSDVSNRLFQVLAASSSASGTGAAGGGSGSTTAS